MKLALALLTTLALATPVPNPDANPAPAPKPVGPPPEWIRPWSKPGWPGPCAHTPMPPNPGECHLVCSTTFGPALADGRCCCFRRW
jgi:hypothetical protein